MDKILTKQLLTSAGIPTAPYLVVEADRLSNLDGLCAEITHTISLPAVVKAPCQGSSVGVYIVNRPSDLPAALKAAFGYGDRVLVERYLNGPEITVPLVGNAVPRTLPLIEITS
jgi:D-alanine-D-alanine ligase